MLFLYGGSENGLRSVWIESDNGDYIQLVSRINQFAAFFDCAANDAAELVPDTAKSYRLVYSKR
jgi:hypothetical protein